MAAKLSNLPRLRSLGRKLRAAPIEWNDAYVRATAAQETLDFLAMAAGIKPVYVAGRGFDDPAWRDAVRAAARTAGFHVRDGPHWRAGAGDDGLPGWFRDAFRAPLDAGRSVWVTRSRRLAAELDAVAAAGGRAEAGLEARLLGFPPCCVAAHRAGAAAFERAVFEMLGARAGGDEAEMRRRAADGAFAPETDEERRRLAEAATLRPAPWTSFNMCEACARGPDSPGARLSARYAAFADALRGRRR